MSSSSLHYDDALDVDPTSTANANNTPVADPTPTAIVASDPVPNTNPLSDTSAIVEVLHDLRFNLSSAGVRRSVDEQTNALLIRPLRRLAACFGMPPNPAIDSCMTSG